MNLWGFFCLVGIWNGTLCLVCNCVVFSRSIIFIVVHRKIRIYDDAASSSCIVLPQRQTHTSTWYVNLSTIKGLVP